MIRTRALRRQQQKNEIDRLAIERIEFDRTIESCEQSKQVIEFGQLAMRDGDAVSDRRRAELFPLQQSLEDFALAQTREGRRACRQFLDRLLLSVDLQCGNDRSEEHTSELQSLVHLVCRLLL